MIENDVRNALLLYGLDDMLNYGWIEQTVGRLRGMERDSPELVQATMQEIRDLLKADYAIVGSMKKDPADGLLMVRTWGLSPEETVERIKESRVDLDVLERTNLVWLELTDKGREEARRLDASGCDPFKE